MTPAAIIEHADQGDVRVELRDHGVAVTTLNRPERLNAVSGQTFVDLAKVLRRAATSTVAAARSSSPAPAHHSVREWISPHHWATVRANAWPLRTGTCDAASPRSSRCAR